MRTLQMQTALSRTRCAPTSKRDQFVLLSLAKYHFLTVEQVARLHYGKSENFVGQRLAEFARGKLLARQELSVPRLNGNRPYVYCLGNTGRRYLETQGFEVGKRLHHSPRHPHKYSGLDHTLTLNDFLISLELFCRAHPRCSITRLVHERTFKQQGSYDRVAVQVGDAPEEQLSVQPDAWVEITTPSGPQWLTVEVDMGTETQTHWR